MMTWNKSMAEVQIGGAVLILWKRETILQAI